ncbi:MAG: penicillin-binding protein 2 [Sulfurovum sp.]
MDKKLQNNAIHQRTYKISILFLLIIFAMLAFLYRVDTIISSPRGMPSHTKTIIDRAFRGAIISADDYTLSSSSKTYYATIRGASINTLKRPLFVKLFSIYSGIDVDIIQSKLKNSQGEYIKGNIILSKDINARFAMQLKSLSYKLQQLNVFDYIKTSNGSKIIYAIDIIENKESRRYPLGDILTPVLGYTKDIPDGRYSRPTGLKGIEQYYNKYIKYKKDGYLKGKRDVVGAIIHDKNSIKMKRIDGYDVHLNISLDVQRRVELMLDDMKAELDADEILVGVMESSTGKLLSLASSNRYNPKNIKDISALVPKFTEYPYEAGSVIKPLTMAIALDKGVVTPKTRFNTNYKRFHIGKNSTISDDERFVSLNSIDILVHSSNIGISQVAWRLTGEEFRDGLLKFGIAKPSGIDLYRDFAGSLKPIKKLNHPLHKANTSYGYGMMSTFAQLLKAYSVFNNDGVMVTPKIVNYISDKKGNHYSIKSNKSKLKVVSKKSANEIKLMLIEVVKRGTGVGATYNGLEVGGKTGTAHIVKNGKYCKEYHSSFYGFVNDKNGTKYTIGVLVIRPKAPQKYFASLSAVPVFRRVLDILVELKYLKPDGDIQLYSPKNSKLKTKTIKNTRVKSKERYKKIEKNSTNHNSIIDLFNLY